MSGRTAHFAALTAFLIVLVAGSAWEMHTLRREGELRLQRDATSLAKRFSLHFALISWEMDVPAARNAIFVEMEDLRLAGMLIYGRKELLEGMRRNSLGDPVPWDDLTPENSVEASAPVMMEDVPVGAVVIYLSRRALDEDLAARARRELVRLTALAVLPCLALALLLWRLAARRATEAEAREASLMPDPPPAAATRYSGSGWEAKAVPPAPNPDSEDARRACPEMCRAFLRDRRTYAALLCRLTAREDWGELREAARTLRETALAIHARPLAEAALAVREAALGNTASAARRVETCISVLARTADAIEQLVRDHAETAPGEQA